MDQRKVAQSRQDIINAALKSGVIDTKMSIETMVSKFGNPINEVAGYVLAWDKYVLVVAEDIKDEVVIKRQSL